MFSGTAVFLLTTLAVFFNSFQHPKSRIPGVNPGMNEIKMRHKMLTLKYFFYLFNKTEEVKNKTETPKKAHKK